ncbi:hypothetical protein DJ71_17570 [Halorubrum sp. E3]|nr:hypothetical protein DJ71_17570 [Halorubrum sp. E3]
MDERAAPDNVSDSADAPRTEGAGRDRDSDDGDDSDAKSSDPFARAKSIGTEAVGAVVDAVLDAI